MLDFQYALERLRGMLWSPVRVSPPPADVVFDRDVAVTVRDGTRLRANVFRPQAPGRYPVLLSLHPYGKDQLPRKFLNGYQPLPTYRLLRQSGPVRHSAWTGWEAPDPAYWVPRGYVVINCDLRGFHRSEGQARLFSEQEAEDYYDLIEWAAAQPWSSGKVGLLGVSYLAITQWRAASLRPPSLAAICPWEGFTNLYRDISYPGGVREDGFVPFWFGRLDKNRVLENLREDQFEHPEFDEVWQRRVPDLSRIEVPALVCGSFSDHNLHSGGSFCGFRDIASPQKWLYTHRSGKWAAFYADEALEFQARFFDHFLQGKENGMAETPRVRLEVREEGSRVREVRMENEWPLARTRWTPLYMSESQQLSLKQPGSGTSRPVTFPEGVFRWDFSFSEDTELTGPMTLMLEVSVDREADLHLFVGVRKFRAGREVHFEGSYGFGRDQVTRGWGRLSRRLLVGSEVAHDANLPVAPEQFLTVPVELMPSATYFRAGEVLRLEVRGHYPYPRHPLFGQFPAGYQPSPPGRLRFHYGNSHLLVPVIPS